MSDRLDQTISSLIENEINHVIRTTNAILKPQSIEAQNLYARYHSWTENARIHNHNLSNLTLGELEQFSVEEFDIPSFKQYVCMQLTEHGYNKNRFEQLMLNDRRHFEWDDQFDHRLDKYVDDLRSICRHSGIIAGHILADDLHQTQTELSVLMKRFNVTAFNQTDSVIGKLDEMESNVISAVEKLNQPSKSDILDIKPNFFGFGLNGNALYKQIQNWWKQRSGKL
ncbi:hypothetical protein EJ063_19895 [Vibrio aquaticus]|uniref:Uncharacterized protein n=2 Tax=Vibrio TaxID=662 RepID=A0A1E5FVF9_VIBSP|nr:MULTISPECIES: hypothetical protein [Vibrio]OEF94487.1 hypothetical protein A142_16975 [Vibrio splendidus 12E03]RTZ13506.1 hypothetical protein EJ063_19895 [Vibrio aquaticus]